MGIQSNKNGFLRFCLHYLFWRVGFFGDFLRLPSGVGPRKQKNLFIRVFWHF